MDGRIIEEKPGVAKSWTAKSFYWGGCLRRASCSGASMTAVLVVAAVYDCRETTESWMTESLKKMGVGKIMDSKIIFLGQLSAARVCSGAPMSAVLAVAICPRSADLRIFIATA
ncbi:MAG: hypothetical protein ACKOHM_07220 [Spartobacteria bacterium]